jgi:hypothetical protein
VKVKSMPIPTITIPLDPQTAQVYESAAPEEKRKMQVLLSIWLRDLAARERRPLSQILDEAAAEAKAKGLTPEMLDSFLEGV